MSEKLGIAYIITNSDIGGAQSHVLELLRAYRNEYDLRVLTSSTGPFTDAVQSLKVPVDFLPALANSLSPAAAFRAVLSTRRWIKSFRPALIHAHSSKAGLVARLAGRSMSIPTVFTAHGWGFKKGTPLLRRIPVYIAELISARLGSAIICVSEHDFNLARRYLPVRENGLHLIRNGIKDCSFRANPRNSPVRIVMVARFKHPKNHRFAVEVFNNLSELVMADFVGDGPDRSLIESLVHQFPRLREKVRFLGDRSDVPEILSNAQIFVLFSDHEGLPISVIEAMRAGLPVVASDVGGLSELVRDGVNGYLIQKNDLTGAGDKLSKLVRDPELRETMGTRGRLEFESHFTPGRMLDSTKRVYEACLGFSTF